MLKSFQRVVCVLLSLVLFFSMYFSVGSFSREDAYADSGSNSFYNPGFELNSNNPYGWVMPEEIDVSVSVDNTISNSGDRSLRVEKNTASGFYLFYNEILVSVSPEKKYDINFHIRTEAMDENTEIYYMIVQYKSDMSVAGPTIFTDKEKGNFNWKEFKHIFTSYEETTSLRVQPIINGGKGTIWFDDFEIIEVIEENITDAFYNSGFELDSNNPLGWVMPAEADISVSVDNTISNSGDRSLKVEKNIDSGFFFFYNEVAEPIKSGKRYVLSFTARTDSMDENTQLYLLIAQYKADLSLAGDNLFTKAERGNFNWKEYRYAFTSYEEAASFRVQPIISGGKGTIWFDDFKIVEEQVSEILENPGFEVGNTKPDGWSISTRGGGSQDFVLDTETMKSGNQSIKVVKTASKGQSRLYSNSTQRVLEGEQYVLSSYVKTSSMSDGAGIFYMISQYRPDGSVAEEICSTLVKGDSDWRKIQYSFQIADSVSEIRVSLMVSEGTGTAWFDDVEVVQKGLVVFSDTIENPGFERGVTNPDGWDIATENGGTHIVLWDNLIYGSGAHSVKIEKTNDEGQSKVKTNSQIRVNQDREYTLSSYIKTDLMSEDTSLVFCVTMYDISGNVVSEKYSPPLKGNSEWREVEYSFKPVANTSSIQISFLLAGGIGIVWIDDVAMDYNMAHNPSLENGSGTFPTDYLLSLGEGGTGSAVWDNEEYHSGSRSIRLEKTNYAGYMILNALKDISVTPQQSYTLSAYVKTEKAIRGKFYFGVNLFNQDSGSFTNTYSIKYKALPAESSSEWTKYEFTFKVPEGVTKVRYQLLASYGILTAWVDDFKLVPANDIAFASDFEDVDSYGNLIGNWKAQSVQGSAEISIDESVSFSGTYSAKISVPEGESQEGYWYTDLYELTPNKKYDISVKYTSDSTFVENNGTAITEILFFNYDNQEIPGSAQISNFDGILGWTNKKISIIIPEGTYKVRLKVGQKSMGGTIFWDNVKIKEASYNAEDNTKFTAQWIWYNESTDEALNAARYFRKSFVLNSEPKNARIQVGVDNSFNLYVNGTLVGSGDAWREPKTFDITEYLNVGTNLVAIRGYNEDSASGVLAEAYIDTNDGSSFDLATDSTWKCSKINSVGWETLDYDDSLWEPSMVLGKPPVGPWGEIVYLLNKAVDTISLKSISLPMSAKSGETVQLSAKFKNTNGISRDYPLTVYIRKNGYVFFEKEISFPIPTSQWKENEIVDISNFEIKIPESLPTGTYQIQMFSTSILFDNTEIKNNIVGNIDIVGTPTTRTPAKVDMQQGSPTLFIMNRGIWEPQVPQYYTAPYNLYDIKTDYVKQFAENGIDVHFTWLKLSSFWVGDGKYDFTQIDNTITHVLNGDPDGKLILYAMLTTPEWWKTENPDELMVSATGSRTQPAYASEKWKSDVGVAITELIKHIQGTPYSDKVIGYVPCGGAAAEWTNYAIYEYPDYSLPMKKYFKNYLIEKYNNDVGELRAAWKDNTVTFETVSIPTVEERTNGTIFMFHDPLVNQKVIDFNVCLSESVADAILYFADLIKENTEKESVVGVYYGYNFEVNTLVAEQGHLSLQKLLDSESIDFIMSPAPYPHRKVGYVGSTMVPVDSVKRSGKMFIMEEDLRSWDAEKTGMDDHDDLTAHATNLHDFTSIAQRNTGLDIAKGFSIRWYDMFGGWFKDRGIQDLIGNIQTVAKGAIKNDRSSNSEVAVILDPGSQLYLYQHKMANLLEELVLDQRDNLGRMGAPYDVFILSEMLNKDMSAYKAVIFLDIFSINDSERAAIDDLKGNNRTLVFAYAPGLINSTIDVDNMKNVTGITLNYKNEENFVEIPISDRNHPFTKDSYVQMLGNSASYGPVFYAEDPDATVLGTISINSKPDNSLNGKAGFVEKSFDDWKSVYFSTPNIPADILRGIIRDAGVHIYSESNGDVIYANKSYLLIHASNPGVRVLKLPYTTAVYDEFGKSYISEATDKITVDLPTGGTKLYRLGSSDATLSDIRVNGNIIAEFAADKYEYSYLLPAGTTVVPTVAATANDSIAVATVTAATSLPGTTTIVVTAKDGTTKTYKINFTVQSTGGDITPTPTPTPLVYEITSSKGGVTTSTMIKAETKTEGTAVATIPESQLTEAIAKAEAEAAKQGNGIGIAINVNVDAPADAKTVGIDLSKELMEKFIDSKADVLTVTTSIGTMTIDKETAKNILKQATGAITITVTRVENSTLPAETQKQIGDRPVVSFNISSGNTAVLQAGKVTVTIPYTLKAGENPKAVIASYINDEGKLVTVTNCIYDPITGSISFKAENAAKFAGGYNKVDFNDVAENAWYNDAVTFLAARGITNGIGNGNFGSDTTVTRAQTLVMIMKAFGIAPDKDAENNFSDAGETYYTGYLAAAMRLGIASGVGSNKFAPDRQVTRQEMFVLIYNTLKNMNELPAITAAKDLTDYKDAGNISDYANEAIALLVKTGIIAGSNGNILPADTASRAQFVQILYNIMTK